jgi:inositol phosphorylceramide mannosyltransferase catalytic subunit
MSNDKAAVHEPAAGIPRVFHQIWVGPARMPELYQGFRLTWQAHHPEWTFRLWSDGDVTPEAFSNYDLIQEAKSPAQRADIMRYEILARHGGVYLDCDFECIKAITPLLEGVEAFACNEVADLSYYCTNAVLGCVPGHPVFQRATQLLRTVVLNTRDIHKRTGPYFFRRCFTEGELTIFPTSWFYPYHFDDPPETFKLPESASALHHWAGSWKR